MAYHNYFLENFTATYENVTSTGIDYVFTYNKYNEAPESFSFHVNNAGYSWCLNAQDPKCVRNYPVFATYQYLRDDDINFPNINSFMVDESYSLSSGSIVFHALDLYGRPKISVIVDHTIYHLNRVNMVDLLEPELCALQIPTFKPNLDVRGLYHG